MTHRTSGPICLRHGFALAALKSTAFPRVQDGACEMSGKRLCSQGNRQGIRRRLTWSLDGLRYNKNSAIAPGEGLS